MGIESDEFWKDLNIPHNVPLCDPNCTHYSTGTSKGHGGLVVKDQGVGRCGAAPPRDNTVYPKTSPCKAPDRRDVG